MKHGGDVGYSTYKGAHVNKTSEVCLFHRKYEIRIVEEVKKLQ